MSSLSLGRWEDVLPTLQDGSVDLVLSDPPFGTTNCAWDTPFDLPSLWREYRRLCTGPILLFAQTPFDKILGASNIRDLRYEWIWEKTQATGHLNAKRAPLKAHENILVFYRKLPAYFPIKTTGHVRKTATRHNQDRSTIYGKQRGGHSYDSTERYPRSVVKFSSDKQRLNLHPAQKPEALIAYLIETYSQPGDTILDNAMGSGTVGVVAKQLGRRFIGVEKDETIFAAAKARIEAARVKEAQPQQEKK